MRIGPEPTTDTFHVVDYAGEIQNCGHSSSYVLCFSNHDGAEEDGHIPGNVLAVDTKKPYTHLQDYGGTFLSR